jgi:ankyrin repeat protein
VSSAWLCRLTIWFSRCHVQAIIKRMDGEKIRVVSSTGREIAALPEFSVTLPFEFPIARPADHETFDFITGQLESRTTPSSSIILGKEPNSSRDVTGIAPTSRSDPDTQRTAAGETGTQNHPFAPVGSSPLSDKGMTLVNSDSVGMLTPDTLLANGIGVGAAGTDLFTNLSDIAAPRRESHIRRSSNGPPLNLNAAVSSTPLTGMGAASAVTDMSHAASAYAPSSSRPNSAAKRRSSGGISDNSLQQQNSSRSARSSGAAVSHVRRGSSSNPPQTASVVDTVKLKPASAVLLKTDSAAAEGVIPWIAPDKFVLIACYGSSTDMENAILRYGPGMIDAIVEPQGFNSLHYAIRRCNVSMVQVLLKHGANPNTPSSNGSTPLLLACKYNCSKVARRILQHKGIQGTALISAETEQKMTPLMWACIHASLELVDLLFAAASRLHVAATQLIKSTNRAGSTALMVALAAYDARFGCTDGELGAWHDENDAHSEPDKGGRSSARDKEGTAEKVRKGSMVTPTSPLPIEMGELTDREVDDKTAGHMAFSFAAPTETGGLSARTDNRSSQREAEKRMLEARKALAWAMRKHRNPLIWASSPPSRHQRSRALARAAMVANRILSAEPSQVKRAAMLMYFLKRDDSSDRWSAVHFAARTGLFAFIDWNLIRSKISLLNLNRATRDGLTCLQLASWNGQAATLAALLLAWPNGYDNPWKNALRINSRLRNRPFTELDLAVMKNHISCSRVLLRSGAILREMSATKGADELLHRLILLGDGVAADALVRNDANKVKVHQVLVDLVYRMKYPDACTFTFAQAHNPFHQFLYECTECGQRICVVCKDRCHGSLGWECSPRTADTEPAATGVQQRKVHSLRPVGFVPDSFCTCLKTTCRALGVIDQREAEGYRFVPNPIDTSSVNIKIGPGLCLAVKMCRIPSYVPLCIFRRNRFGRLDRKACMEQSRSLV